MSAHPHGPDGQCPELEDLSALLDGELDAARAAEVRAHTAGCASCGPVLARLERAAAAVRALPREEASPELVRRVVAGARPRSAWRDVTKLAMAAGILLGGVLMITVVTQQQAQHDQIAAPSLARVEPARPAPEPVTEQRRQVPAADGGTAVAMAELQQAPPSLEKLAANSGPARDLDDNRAERESAPRAAKDEQVADDIAAMAPVVAPAPAPAAPSAKKTMEPSGAGTRARLDGGAAQRAATPAEADVAEESGVEGAALASGVVGAGEADAAFGAKSRSAEDARMGRDDVPTACAVHLRAKRDAAPETLARIVSDPVVQVPLDAASSRRLQRVNARVLVDGARGTACSVDIAALAATHRDVVDRAVRNAIATWTFAPALRGGAPVPSVLDLSITLESRL